MTAARLPADLCGGDGVETQPTADGPEHFACTGCAACARSGAEHYRRRAARAGGPFALLPTPLDLEAEEF